jgi:hypothetical protein
MKVKITGKNGIGFNGFRTKSITIKEWHKTGKERHKGRQGMAQTQARKGTKEEGKIQRQARKGTRPAGKENQYLRLR